VLLASKRRSLVVARRASLARSYLQDDPNSSAKEGDRPSNEEEDKNPNDGVKRVLRHGVD